MLLVPPATREKYPLWVVTHTERRRPRRVGPKTNVDDDGNREYSIIACLHACGCEIPVLTASIAAHKNQAVEDHLAQCVALSADERPTKKRRGGFSVRALLHPDNATLLEPLHARCRQEMDDLKERTSALERKSLVYDACVSAVLPSIILPLVQHTGEVQLRDAIAKDIVPPKMIQEITEQRDAMEHKMEQQREDMKQQTADIIRHSDNRWSSFANVMVNKFPSLQEPVNDETIPQQMCIRERSIQLSSSSELEAVRLENRELRTTNKGLVEAQKTLNEKFRVVLQDRDARVDVTTYQRLLAKYDKLRTTPKHNRESMESFRTVKRQPIAE